MVLGFGIFDLGNHWYKKWVESMVSVGCTFLPPIVSVFIRAGWVIGEVKDKYLKCKSTGYWYMGRWDAGFGQLKN